MGKWHQNKKAIYMIINLVNGKIYIGSALNYVKRFNQHKFEFRSNTHDNLHFLRSWNKYGEQKFRFCIIELIEDKENLIEKEQYWMDLLKPEYNIRKNAQSNLGCTWKLNDISIENIRKASTGRKVSDEHKEHLKMCLTGIKRSEETKNKISNSKKGKPWSLARCKSQYERNK